MLRLGKYRHYKGSHYQVLGTVMHTETQAPMVHYKALYNVVVDKSTYGETMEFVRPLNMWLEKVELNGTTVDRFTFIND